MWKANKIQLLPLGQKIRIQGPSLAMDGDITSMLLKPKSHSNWVCQSSGQGTNPLEGLLPLTEETGGIIIPFMK